MTSQRRVHAEHLDGRSGAAGPVPSDTGSGLLSGCSWSTASSPTGAPRGCAHGGCQRDGSTQVHGMIQAQASLRSPLLLLLLLLLLGGRRSHRQGWNRSGLCPMAC